MPEEKPTTETIEEKLRQCSRRYREQLKESIDERMKEMEQDDRSHFLIYQVLGIGESEGRLIDEYQNKGRFLFKSAGAFLEEAAKLCFLEKFPEAKSHKVPNPQKGAKPKTFGIDCLVNSDALEIKWRDATTDGDHILKENARIKAIKDAGYTPIRVMFYRPNREQAIRIQNTLENVYKGVGGRYYAGELAWEYVKSQTGTDLFAILQTLAKENATNI